MPLNNFGRRIDGQFVSALNLVHKRELFKKVYNKFPDEVYFGFLEEMGRMIPVEQETYSWYEKESIFEAPVIASKANGTGSAVLVTLAAASHDEGGTVSYVREGDIVQFANGTTGYVQVKTTTTPGAHVLTIQPTAADQNVQTAAVATETFIIQSSAFGEGTGQPEGLTPKIYTASNKVQIFKNSTPIITGSEDTSTVEFEINGKPYYSELAEEDTAMMHRAKEEMGLLWNKIDGGALVDKNGVNVRITNGLIPGIAASGIAHNYTDAPTSLDMKSIVKKLDAVGGSDENILLAGIDLNLSADDIVTNIQQENAISYDMIGGKRVAEIHGFDSLKYGGYTFHKKLMKLFSHPKLGGATGFTWSTTGILCPLDKLRDPTSQKMEYAFAVRYKNAPGRNRGYKTWETGANAATPTDDQDVRKRHYLSEKGGQYMGLNRYALIKKA
jgi:hypothetical protein